MTTTIDRLVDPDSNGIEPSPDPWDGVDLTVQRPGPKATPAERMQARQAEQEQARNAIGAWLDHLVTTPRPLEEWMAWFWHGHFVSALDKVKVPALMVQQLRTFRSLALEPFPQLLRAATVDPAMLLYLDGNASTGAQPNENYGRELLELFTLGLGNYTEDDVKAGAAALTGWTIDRQTGEARLVRGRHDDTSRSYLGSAQVHDVDTVVEAVTSHPACAPFVSGKVARAILGPDVDRGVVDDLAAGFASSGLDTRSLVRSILDAAASGAARPAVAAPVPWVVAAQRATGGMLTPDARLAGLRAAGQLPMMPPNVAGWPTGAAWFGASTVVARCNFANEIATTTPAGAPARAAAASFDLDALADALGHPDGFGNATRDALATVRSDPRAVLAGALASPELSLC